MVVSTTDYRGEIEPGTLVGFRTDYDGPCVGRVERIGEDGVAYVRLIGEERTVPVPVDAIQSVGADEPFKDRRYKPGV